MGRSYTFFALLCASILLHGIAPAAEKQISITISAAVDDAYENLITNNVTTNYRFVYPGMSYLLGYRFSDVSIPPGAAILSAKLLQYCTGSGTRASSMTYWGEDAMDSTAFAGAKYNLSSRSKTSATVAVNAAPWTVHQYNPSPDLKSIIQEIVNTPGWQSGDHLTLLVSTVKTRTVDLFEANPSHAAILQVTFDDGAHTVPDTTQPSVTILNPPADYQSADPTIDINGTSSDNVGVTSVTWQTDNGRSGSASGTTQWIIKGLDLQEGRNTITVTADDAAGNAGSASIVLAYTPPAPPPSTAGFEGFGQAVTGGRGHTVYTAQSPSDLTSIYTKVKTSRGNAVINLEGSWTYTSSLKFENMSNLTINGMGSSVIFDGVTLTFVNDENLILQGLRVRRHQEVGNDCIQINSVRQAVIDHCSVSEAGDGNMDITGYSAGASSDITVSYCILANTWKQQLVKYNQTTNITFHHNLYYNSGGRVPHLNEGIFDFRNNLIWQWGSYATTLSSGARANIINNYTVQRPGSSKASSAIWYTDSTSQAWIAGNVLPAQETDTSRLSAPLTVPPVTTQTAEQARAAILDQAGALPRDAYDQQVTDNVRNGVFPPPPPQHD